ncbi:glutathione S-transferase [Photobacterium kishitanii]|uniref:Glutathione S-transferase n=1 Tax=Photobacterium kishitanii TaxID=318456 RepID=A0A0B7JJW9_9GAMM|nr:glutathione S-transferase [Photobacterium kishitanii]OBU28863.1 glutathione S-transferase [Photobacterium kishitanii]PSU99157.1 glutathione S-transferase [Photobacterium kishitanii]PSV17654.1 glutathione S-transferase [Photobacterium kishitanii]PSW71596.1 glutathione S-transferase [Photobacterium kishitanii]CEO42144.1 putative glutathione S-transferase [Photobacterium kishitanii]
MTQPILYTLRQCPYAIRARLGLRLAEQNVEIRDISLKNKPAEMLAITHKGTVPLLVLGNGDYIDESLTIMIWALNQHDPQNLLLADSSHLFTDMLNLIARNDCKYIAALEHYKADIRYHNPDVAIYRNLCQSFLDDLELRLEKHSFFMCDKPSLADYAILPFIRQFSHVERQWFRHAPYPKLKVWLEQHYQDPIFSKVMEKKQLWQPTRLINNTHQEIV